MSQKSSRTIGPSPIEEVLLAECFERPAGFAFVASSLPGHLLQLVLEGAVRQECNGRVYELRPGMVIWYHEDEWVRGEVLESPWRFCSVNFIAPALPPPAEDRRLFPDRMDLRPAFEGVLRAWQDADAGPLAQAFSVHAALHEILAGLSGPAPRHWSVDPGARLWWAIETAYRRDLQHPARLTDLAERFGRSAATINRACRQAVGMSPMKRLKQVRMHLARGLVHRSGLTVSEIACRVGYPRVHEFSRDYRAWFGCSPTADRESRPQRAS